MVLPCHYLVFSLGVLFWLVSSRWERKQMDNFINLCMGTCFGSRRQMLFWVFRILLGRCKSDLRICHLNSTLARLWTLWGTSFYDCSVFPNVWWKKKSPAFVLVEWIYSPVFKKQDHTNKEREGREIFRDSGSITHSHTGTLYPWGFFSPALDSTTRTDLSSRRWMWFPGWFCGPQRTLLSALPWVHHLFLPWSWS